MNVLIAEDDDATARRIAQLLAAEGHRTIVVASGQAALDRLREGGVDVAILDRLLPETDGMAVLREMREMEIGTHVLMLTALGSIADRVQGLEAGADDYLTKPFAMDELLARVNALQRRRAKEGHAAMMLRAGDLTLDVVRRDTRYRGRFIALQPRELRLLEELLRGRGETLTRSMLLQRVWGFHFEPRTNLVETHMSRLRFKLSMAGATDVIKTVRGSGYRLQIDE